MSISIRVQHERDQALQDISNIINEYGEDVTLFIRCEASIGRDKYGSIISSDTDGEDIQFDIKSYPVNNNPTRYQMEKAGIHTACECIAWVASKDLTDKGLTFDSINVQRSRVIIDGQQYGISSKSKVNPYADAHLYITFGLFKK